MFDKERLRKLFGQFGDVHRTLEKMFGKAYLDHPDDLADVPDEMRELAQATGTEVF